MRNRQQTETQVDAGVVSHGLTRRSVLSAGIALTASLFVSAIDVNARQESATPPAMGTPEAFAAWFTAFGQRGTTAEGWPIEVVLATPEYLQGVDRWKEFAELQPDKSLVVLTLERHAGAIAQSAASRTLLLRVDGQENLQPAEVRIVRRDAEVSEEAHVFRDIKPTILAENHLIEIELPGPANAAPLVFFWITPLVSPEGIGTPVAGPESTPSPSESNEVDVLETVLPSEEIEICMTSDSASRA